MFQLGWRRFKEDYDGPKLLKMVLISMDVQIFIVTEWEKQFI